MCAMSDSPEGQPQTACWSCRAPIDQDDNYCRRCGMGQGGHVPWQYKHWGVAAVTLLGLGPFSLFYLWRSPVISRGSKVVYTLAILLATLMVIGWLRHVWELWRSAFSGMGDIQLY